MNCTLVIFIAERNNLSGGYSVLYIQIRKNCAYLSFYMGLFADLEFENLTVKVFKFLFKYRHKLLNFFN